MTDANESADATIAEDSVTLSGEECRRLRRSSGILSDAVFLVDGAPWLQAALFEENLRFQHVTHGNWNSVERIFKEVKRRTNQFANHFRNATHRTAEN
jgi:transposase-like protein